MHHFNAIILILLGLFAFVYASQDIDRCKAMIKSDLQDEYEPTQVVSVSTTPKKILTSTTGKVILMAQSISGTKNVNPGSTIVTNALLTLAESGSGGSATVINGVKWKFIACM